MRRMYSLKQLEEIANARVKALVEGGTLDNAKPIYIHPISVVNNINSNYRFRLTMLIFNNDPTPFTRETLNAYIKSIPQARFLVSGSYAQLGENGFYMANCFVFYNPSSTPDDLWLIGIDNNGNDHTSATNPINFTTLLNDATAFDDGVNKIN